MSAGQSRRASLIESLVNVAVGFGVALAAQGAFLHAAGYELPMPVQIAMGGWLTLVSVCRSYLLRRLFNWLTVRRVRRAR